MMRNPLLNHLRNAASTALLVLGPIVLLNGQSPSIDGRVWFNTPSGTTANLNSLSSFGSDYAVTVGFGGTVQRYSDDAWATFPGASAPWGDPPTGLSSVAVISPNNIWVGSNSGTASLRGVAHWDGNAWSSIMHPAGNASNQRVLGLWADQASGYVFAALQSGRVTFYNGSVWSNLATPGGTADMQAVHGTGLDNIWAVGSSGQVYQSTTAGASWTVRNVGEAYATTNWMGVYTLAENRAWMVGAGGEIAFWNGVEFNVTQPTTQTLRDVYAIDENHVYAVGSAPGTSGTFLYFDGVEWNPMNLDPEVTQNTWYAIDGDGTRIWLAGNGGTILTSIPEPSQVALAVVILLPVLIRLLRQRRTAS